MADTGLAPVLAGDETRKPHCTGRRLGNKGRLVPFPETNNSTTGERQEDFILHAHYFPRPSSMRNDDNTIVIRIKDNADSQRAIVQGRQALANCFGVEHDCFSRIQYRADMMFAGDAQNRHLLYAGDADANLVKRADKIIYKFHFRFYGFFN